MKKNYFISILRIISIGILCCSFSNLFAQTIDIPVAIHILRDNNGNNARATSAQADIEIANLNNAYNYLNITFTKCSQDFIDSNVLWNQFDDGDDDQKLLLDPHSIKNVVNIFITDLEGGGHGKAVFPYKQKDWILVDYEVLNTSTIVHEFGHYFGLRHTYQGVDDDNPASSNSLTINQAEGVDGWKYGDYLIDTPLDPENRSDYDSNCNYTGNQVDANGTSFHPNGKNYMGKGHNFCRSEFSPGQEARMLDYIKRYRYYLKCNDTSETNFICTSSQVVSTFPHNDDFDRDDTSNFYWVQARYGDDQNWSNAPNTSSSSTGPEIAQNGQTFMYFEASLKYTSSDEAILLSPCYDFNTSTDPKIEFYYHMYGEDTGSLLLDITIDNGVNWNTIFSISGQQQNFENSPWIAKEVSLKDYIGQNAQLRFKAIGSGDSKSDIAIDNVTVSSEGTLSTSDNEFNTSLNVYPNPANEKIIIEGINLNSEQLRIFNTLGQDVTALSKIVEVNEKKAIINLSNLNNGLYFIKSGTTMNKLYKL